MHQVTHAYLMSTGVLRLHWDALIHAHGRRVCGYGGVRTCKPYLLDGECMRMCMCKAYLLDGECPLERGLRLVESATPVNVNAQAHAAGER